MTPTLTLARLLEPASFFPSLQSDIKHLTPPFNLHLNWFGFISICLWLSSAFTFFNHKFAFFIEQCLCCHPFQVLSLELHFILGFSYVCFLQSPLFVLPYFSTIFALLLCYWLIFLLFLLLNAGLLLSFHNIGLNIFFIAFVAFSHAWL